MNINSECEQDKEREREREKERYRNESVRFGCTGQDGIRSRARGIRVNESSVGYG